MLKTNDQRKFLFCLTVPNCALLFSTAIVFETEDIFYLLSKSSTLNKTHECMWATLLEVYGPCSRPVLGHEVYSVEANWANYLPPPPPTLPVQILSFPGGETGCRKRTTTAVTRRQKNTRSWWGAWQIASSLGSSCSWVNSPQHHAHIGGVVNQLSVCETLLLLIRIQIIF